MQKQEIEALTGLRLFAALWVFLYHVGWVFLKDLFPAFWSDYYRLLFQGGGMGVDLFFVLSGFIIAYHYSDHFAPGQRGHYFSFLWKRFARLYPLHLATLLFLVIAGIGAFGQGPFLFGDATAFLKHVVLVQALLPPIQWNTVSWSISCEWLAYCLFPVFLLALRFCNSRTRILLAVLAIYLVALALFILLAVQRVSFEHPAYWLLRIGSEFPVGILLYQLWQQRSGRPFSAGFRKGVVPLLALFLFLISHNPLSFVLVLPFFFLLVYLIVSDQFVFSNALRAKGVLYGGRVSYSLYMVHGMTLVIFSRWMTVHGYVEADLQTKLLFVAAYCGVTVGLSVLFFHGIEEPARRWLLRPRHPAVPAAFARFKSAPAVAPDKP